MCKLFALYAQNIGGFMNNRGFRRSNVLILALLPALLAVPWAASWAQNENESVGFQPTHIFQSADFGENVDVLNGGLTIGIPIGQKYQVSQHLGYQLTLSYSSKIWDESSWRNFFGGSAQLVVHQSGMGLGFNLNFGRIYRDVAVVSKRLRDTGGGPPIETQDTECTWYYVTPDGNQHELPTVDEPGTPDVCYKGPSEVTIDGTYFGPGTYIGDDTDPTHAHPSWDSWDGTTSYPIPTIVTPEGLRYIFDHYVRTNGITGAPLNAPNGPPSFDPDTRRYNQEFGGWYVTRIEDLNAGFDCAGPNCYDKKYRRRVEITYDSRPGYEHLIQQITDSTGRHVDFVNDCEHVTPSDPNSACLADSSITKPGNSPMRSATRTVKIKVPAFAANGAVQTGVQATYDFSYEFKQLKTMGCEVDSILHITCIDRTRNLLKSIKYPTLTTNTGTTLDADRYSMQFTYSDYGEMESRTLPTGAIVGYLWGDYEYIASGGSGSDAMGNPSARQIQVRNVTLGPGKIYTWAYVRLANGYSNPFSVTLWDPFGNDTVYYFHASRLDPSGLVGMDPEDGVAPEWNDGLNYRIDHFAGHGADRVLFRTESIDHTADHRQPSMFLTSRDRCHIRSWRESTTYTDDGGRVATKLNADWDGMGHWRQVTESGFDVPGVRITRTNYFSHGADDWFSREVSDGQTTVSRVDQVFLRPNHASFLPPILCGSIARLTMPSDPTAPIMSGQGDITTWYQYEQDSGNVAEKFLSDGPGSDALSCMRPGGGVGSPDALVEVHGAPAATHAMQYTWNAGGYLATKQSAKSIVAGTPTWFTWLGIDRTRDGNTGLIWKTRDTAQVETTYIYDELGRVREILPPGSEYPTQVQYSDVDHTSVRQGPETTQGSSFGCGTATGDVVLTCYGYDNLGRVVLTEKRPYSTTRGIAYQKLDYDIDGQKTYETEWAYAPGPSNYCHVPSEIALGSPEVPCPGTKISYLSPNAGHARDPFGRVRSVITADNKTTETGYSGLTSVITVKGIQGKDDLFDATTTYFRDAFGRLIYVQSPATIVGGNDVLGGADAQYTYDAADNLIQADLLPKTMPGVQSRYFEYDHLKRLTRSTNPEDGTVRFTEYDALGNLTRRIDAQGTVQTKAYDLAGRLLTSGKQTAEGLNAGVSVTLLTNTYDSPPSGNIHEFLNSSGRLLVSTSSDDNGLPEVTKEYSYGGLSGRLSKQRSYFGRFSTVELTMQSTYNNFGLLSSVVYPEADPIQNGSLTINYDYSNGVPVVMRGTGVATPLATATYNASGGVEEVATLGNVKTRITPDPQNRPSSIAIGRFDAGNGQFTGTNYFASGAYHYDGAGNIWAIDGGIIPGDQPETYAYDAANRLVQAQLWDGSFQWTEQYAYDDYGNMTAHQRWNHSGVKTLDTSFFTTDSILHRSQNRVKSVVEGTGGSVRAFEYDARGNLAYEDRDTTGEGYVYDSLNRMTRAAQLTSSGAAVVGEYHYDESSYRTERHDLGRQLRTYYVRDLSGRLMTEFRRTSLGTYAPEWSKHYFYLGSRLVGVEENLRPSPPSQLDGHIDAATTVRVTWQANPLSESVASYKVYRAPYVLNNPTWTLLGQSSTATYTDNTVSSGTSYLYQVTAVNAVGEGYGSDLGIMGGDTVVPTPPANLLAVGSDSKVELGWKEPVLSWTQKVAGYHVYRRIVDIATPCPAFVPSDLLVELPRPTGAYAPGTLDPKPTYVDLAVINGQYYCYTVRSFDTVGLESINSNTQKVLARDFTPPSPPRDVRAVSDCAGASKIYVTWDANAPEESSTVGGPTYTITRTPAFPTCGNPSGCPESTPVLQGDGQHWGVTDATVVLGTQYTYSVVARDQDINASAASAASTKLEHVLGLAGAPPVPLRPVASSMDGIVHIRVGWAGASYALRVYRRYSVGLTCENYDLIGELSGDQLSPAGAFYEYVDAPTEANVAYDYAVTNVSTSGVESPFSALAVVVPTQAPVAVNTCIEEWSDGTTKEGDVNCIALGKHRRVAVRWGAVATPPYQPIQATNASGVLGYLVGYHVYQFSNSLSNIASHIDSAVRSPISLDGHSYVCANHITMTCGMNADCPPGDTCTQPVSAVLSNLPGECSNESIACREDADCASGVCIVKVPDPFLLQHHDQVFYTDCGNGGACGVCYGVSAVYKVFADGNWQTVESDVSGEMDSAEPADPNHGCHRSVPNLCQFNQGSLDYLGRTRLCSPLQPRPPQVTAAPTVVASADTAGNVTVSWMPASTGLCQLVNLDKTCLTTATSGSAACPPDQYCFQCDREEPNCSDITVGSCRLLIPSTCNPDVPPRGGCPDGQSCQAQDIGGYRVYAEEQRSNSVLSLKQPSPHFVRPLAAVTVPADQMPYTFTGIASDTAISFRIGTTDSSGQVADASPPSVTIVPGQDTIAAIAAPQGVKAILWTAGDAIRPFLAYPLDLDENPRELHGIKVAWRRGASGNTLAGFRVYRNTIRSTTGACLLVQYSDTGNPAGETLCKSDLDQSIGAPNAYSESLTTLTESLIDNERTAFNDLGVVEGRVYYYFVKAVGTGGTVSQPSAIVAAMALPQEHEPLSSPRHLNAHAAPLYQGDGRGINLKWCMNPTQEGVTAYRIYRWKDSDSPWGPTTTPYVTVDLNIPAQAQCLDGHHQCTIATDHLLHTSATCTPGVTGSCVIVDLDVAPYPTFAEEFSAQVSDHVYNYGVTAMRGAEESPMSIPNQGWPNYCPATGACTNYRFDPDDSATIACDDEVATIQVDPQDEGADTAVAVRNNAGTEEGLVRDKDSMAPYRTAGIVQDGNPGGGGGGGNPPPAATRFLFYHLDHLGSPRVITDAAGNLVSKQHFMPFGDEVPGTDATSRSTSKFTGHERDGDTGNDYMMARYYSSSLDRFLSIDPSRKSVSLTSPHTWNRYSYARNNPVSRIDADGRTDIYVGGANDSIIQQVMGYVNDHPGGPGRDVKAFYFWQIQEAIDYANTRVGNGQPTNIIATSWGSAVAPFIAGAVHGPVDLLVGVDPVGLPGTFGQTARPGNVKMVVTVNSEPKSPGWNDIVEFVGVCLLDGGRPEAFVDEADVTIDTDKDHAAFGAQYNAPGSNGLSASDYVNLSYIAGVAPSESPQNYCPATGSIDDYEHFSSKPAWAP